MYQTKRQRITNYLKNVFHHLKENGRTGNLPTIIALCSIELGVKEKDIEEAIHTFERAKFIEINDDEIIV